MSRTQSSSSESGFTLAALIVILTILMIIIAFTVPRQWSMVMARERDKQTIFVMKQYARAIREWSQKNGGALPTSLDQLKEARKPRFVRGDGELEDPLTGKFDWILVPPTAVQGGAQPPAGRVLQPGTNPGSNRLSGIGGAPPPVGGPSKLNAAASPKDYVGPFVGVRPPKTGQSFLTFKDAESYEEWVYTLYDVQNDINMRDAALLAK